MSSDRRADGSMPGDADDAAPMRSAEEMRARLVSQRSRIAALARSIAATEDEVAATLRAMAATSPERAERLLSEALEAERVAIAERARADEYEQ